MDVAATSVMLSQYKIQESAGILVMKKALTSASQDGEDLVRMMVQSAVEPYDPNLGSNLDEYV